MTAKEYNKGVRLWADDAMRFAMRCCPSRPDCEDAVQEALASLWSHRDEVAAAKGKGYLLSVATSIDAFAVGIGLGLQETLLNVLWIVLTISVVTILVSLLGVYLGKRHIPVPEKSANIIAGLVLVALGVKILFEHLILV